MKYVNFTTKFSPLNIQQETLAMLICGRGFHKKTPVQLIVIHAESLSNTQFPFSMNVYTV